jgi:PhzF family phenazine biosynthesis protein
MQQFRKMEIVLKVCTVDSTAYIAKHYRKRIVRARSTIKQLILMKLELYQVDAFTDTIFGGNPACVVPLQEWLPDTILFKIAQENAVAETAFFINKGDTILLRWFTPEIEIDLCGHATLATAHVLASHLGHPEKEIRFSTQSGDLIVTIGHELYTLNFPSRKPVAAHLPEIIKNALSLQPKEVLKARDYVLVYESEQDIRNISINRQLFDQINLDPGGVIVTARGTSCDFVSRFFTPQASILEDPVTGSAHCSLIPYWSEQLQKVELTALQLSERLGKLYCTNKSDRVLISGQARTYSAGYVWTE